jgi:hypothetical protein
MLHCLLQSVRRPHRPLLATMRAAWSSVLWAQWERGFRLVQIAFVELTLGTCRKRPHESRATIEVRVLLRVWQCQGLAARPAPVPLTGGAAHQVTSARTFHTHATGGTRSSVLNQPVIERPGARIETFCISYHFLVYRTMT